MSTFLKAMTVANPKALMGLGIKGGDTVTITVEGGNEDASLKSMEQFFQENL